jgi:hypothetical protein
MINKLAKIKYQFETEGYCIIRSFLTNREILSFEKELIRIYSAKLKKKITKNNINEIITSLEKSKKFDLLYSCYKKFISSKPYKLIEKKLCFFSKKIFKKEFRYLNSGMAIGIKNSERTAYNWHQEKSYYDLDKLSIHFQFPIMINANKKNGTMSVLKKSHISGEIKEVLNIKLSKNSINTHLPKNISKLKKKFNEKFINMKTRDICLFSENIIHRSNKNFTNKIRFVPIIRLKSLT